MIRQAVLQLKPQKGHLGANLEYLALAKLDLKWAKLDFGNGEAWFEMGE